MIKEWWSNLYFKYLWWRAGRKFRPRVFYCENLKLTEIILEDTNIVWCPWGPYDGHAVDLGYTFDNKLVGVRIWDDVRNRPERSKATKELPK